jgi:hypothetical protein
MTGRINHLSGDWAMGRIYEQRGVDGYAPMLDEAKAEFETALALALARLRKAQRAVTGRTAADGPPVLSSRSQTTLPQLAKWAGWVHTVDRGGFQPETRSPRRHGG